MTNLLFSRSSKLLIQVWSFEQENCSGNLYPRTGQKDVDVNHPREIAIDDTVSIVLHRNRIPSNQDLPVVFQVMSDRVSNSWKPQKHLRYCHVFRENEQDDMTKRVPDEVTVPAHSLE